MKKRIFSLFLVAAMVMTATSCTNNNATAISSVDDTQPVILEEPSEIVEIVEVKSEIESESESEVVSEVVEEDPLEILKTSEEVAKEVGGVFLIRDGKYYTLSYGFRARAGVEYPSAFVDEPISMNRERLQCFYKPFPGTWEYLSLGDVPVPAISNDDKVVYRSTSKTPVLRLIKIDNHGYSLPLIQYGNSYRIYYLETGEEERLDGNTMSNFTVTCNGREIEDWHHLEDGQECRITWYQGTEMQERNLVANCAYYDFRLYDYVDLEGTLGENGLEYDLSGISSGFYVLYAMYDGRATGTDIGGIIEIQ